jgi:hypothetical protein
MGYQKLQGLAFVIYPNQHFVSAKTFRLQDEIPFPEQQSLGA